jgi:hypothetical protein
MAGIAVDDHGFRVRPSVKDRREAGERTSYRVADVLAKGISWPAVP